MIYFLVVNYYSTNLITKLISSLPSYDSYDYKVVIVNNSPDDNSIYNLKNESVVIFNAESNLGFGGGCNFGLKWIYTQDSQGIVWIINPDAYFVENTIEKVPLFFETHPNISLLGTIDHTTTGEVWFAGGRFILSTGAIVTQDLLTNTDTDYVVCDWITGCSLIVNLRNFDDCPQFDPAYFLYYEDFDFCRRYANQGHLIAVTKQFGVIHQPSSITNRYVFRKIKNSTYGYLLSLDRYTNQWIVKIRLLRLISHALVLMFVKPQVAFGKFAGMLMYWRR
ncbi:glycosyltransferase [Brasilonema octagenarum]|uniref:Glycosyltransferase family 2 protein n=1 Tax=Brasilonema octagenarum UFV-OR1 TaxID=417115 RepID=A0ABX1M2S0_9CYAN|nr:glycosyltransferase family 2 protein [Brasilonema octagenarum UFV-OR1]